MNELDIAYYAGFFDGEGSAFLLNYNDRHGKSRTRLRATVTQVDRRVLDTLVAELKCGTVQSKHDKRIAEKGWQEAYVAVFSDRAAREFLVLIEPHLRVKKDHVSGLLDVTGRSITKGSLKKPL